MAKATRKKSDPETSTVQEDQPEASNTETTNVQDDAGQQQPEAPPPPPPAQPPVTKEVIEARFRVELTKFNYEAGLQAITSYKITEDNLKDAPEKMMAARKLLRKFDDIKDNLKKPVLERGRLIDAAYNSLKKPLEEELTKKQADLNRVAKEQADKQKKLDDEKIRVDGIKKDMDNTLMGHSQAIAGAKTADELVTIEKTLGSQKANKARFQEFLPEFVQRAGELTPLIKLQKEAIRELARIKEEQEKAEQSGDDAAFIALEEKKEGITARIDETQVLVQEKAINMATRPDTNVEIARPVFNTVAARRTSWEAEISSEPKSLEKAFKAGLLDCTINKEKSKTIIDALKSSGNLKDKTEITIDGIRYFEKKLF